MQTIYESFIASCDAQPDKALFERPDAPDITYAEARDLVQRFATVLTDIGVRPGDRVAVQTERAPRPSASIWRRYRSAASTCL